MIQSTEAVHVRAGSEAGIPPLDGLRGIAAVLVFLTHVGFVTGSYQAGALGAALARFDIGVALFFVLSGFLLTRAWVRSAGGRAPGVRRYAVRRAARILPAYWVALLVVLLTAARGSDWLAVASNATLTQVYSGLFLDAFTQTWSLCTEVAFYVVLPVVAVPLVRCRRRTALLVLLSASLLSLAWVALVASDVLGITRLAALWLPGHLSWFAGGVALAILEPALRDRASRVAQALLEPLTSPWSIVALAATVFALACTPIAGPLTLVPPAPLTAVAKEVLYLVVAVLLVLAAGFGRPSSSLCRVLGGRVGRVLGRVSYGVFLWHLLVVEAVMQVLGMELFSGGLVVLTALGLIGTYAVAEVSWHVVERPILVRAGAHPR